MKVLYFSDNTSAHNQRFLEKLSQAGLEVWFLDPISNWVPKAGCPRECTGLEPNGRSRRIRTRRRLPIFCLSSSACCAR